MYKIGLDFGTTNSILSYFDDNTFQTFRMASAGDTDYIPSFVSYDQAGTPCIGLRSRSKLGDNRYATYSRFKIFLGESDRKKLQDHRYEKRTPAQVAKDYLDQLHSSFKQNHTGGKPIENIVVTVPEIWVKDQQHLARETLMKICGELNLPLKCFLSEPVAAALYFCYLYKKKEKQNFIGHILVCDCGGGTLDLSLCRAEPRKKVTVLERTGKGYSENAVGKAGVAFDEKAVINVYTRVKGKFPTRDDSFYQILENFENKKIQEKVEIDNALERYLKNATADFEIFKLLNDDTLWVKSSDLVRAFEQEIASELKDALETMREYIQQNNINAADEKHFRILMVGGFSNFYLVEKAVKECFGINSQNDQRFQSYFSIADKALAISKGAALFAAGEFEVVETCPISVGIKMWSDKETGELKRVDELILEKGKKISDYKEPRYHDALFEFAQKEVDSIVIFIDNGKDRFPLDLQKDLGGDIDLLFPDLMPYKKEWKIGFSVDDNLIFTLHVKNQSKGGVRKIDFGDLLKKMNYPIARKSVSR